MSRRIDIPRVQVFCSESKRSVGSLRSPPGTSKNKSGMTPIAPSNVPTILASVTRPCSIGGNDNRFAFDRKDRPPDPSLTAPA